MVVPTGVFIELVEDDRGSIQCVVECFGREGHSLVIY